MLSCVISCYCTLHIYGDYVAGVLLQDVVLFGMRNNVVGRCFCNSVI